MTGAGMCGRCGEAMRRIAAEIRLHPAYFELDTLADELEELSCATQVSAPPALTAEKPVAEWPSTADTTWPSQRVMDHAVKQVREIVDGHKSDTLPKMPDAVVASNRKLLAAMRAVNIDAQDAFGSVSDQTSAGRTARRYLEKIIRKSNTAIDAATRPNPPVPKENGK